METLSEKLISLIGKSKKLNKIIMAMLAEVSAYRFLETGVEVDFYGSCSRLYQRVGPDTIIDQLLKELPNCVIARTGEGEMKDTSFLAYLHLKFFSAKVPEPPKASVLSLGLDALYYDRCALVEGNAIAFSSDSSTYLVCFNKIPSRELKPKEFNLLREAIIGLFKGVEEVKTDLKFFKDAIDDQDEYYLRDASLDTDLHYRRIEEIRRDMTEPKFPHREDSFKELINDELL